MILCRCHHRARCKVKEMKDEFVRVLCFNSKRSDGIRRKVPQVHGHDDICVATNGRGQHMPVVRIGEL